MPIEKLKTQDEMAEIIKSLKNQGKRVVLANGCFDIFHGGHISYLESARSLGDVLVVALNSDTSIQKLKGKGRPIIPEQERAELLSEMEAVDYIVLFDEETCDKVLERLRPDIHAKGTDYTVETVPERETARRLNIETRIVGDPKENATRDIISKVLRLYGKNKSKV